MSAHRTAFAALDTRMAAFTPATPTAWPNREYSPVAGTDWLQVAHLPAPTVRRSIGADGQNAYTGIYQITVNTAPGAGPGHAESLADTVANHFPLGAVFGGVRIAAVSCAPALQDSGWYRIPVSVTYELVTSA